MTRYLLDTNVLIDFSKGIESVTEQLLAWIDSTDIVAVCAISVAEFYAVLTPTKPLRPRPSWPRSPTGISAETQRRVPVRIATASLALVSPSPSWTRSLPRLPESTLRPL